MEKHRVKKLEELPQLARTFVQKYPHPQVVLLHGAMGMGKTTFTKSLIKALGSLEEASSPTFSIVNEYRDQLGVSIFHFDLYRMEQPEEALDMGIEEYFDMGVWCFVEWPEKALQYMPEEAIEIHISEEDGFRVFEF